MADDGRDRFAGQPVTAMQWWCFASGAAWEWEWRAYPGVWLAMAMLVLGYRTFHLRARTGAAAPAEAAVPGTVNPGASGAGSGAGDLASGGRHRPVAFGLGVASLWVALDWPVGALGAGYLASVHMLQFLILTCIAPPLLIRGVAPAAMRRLEGHPAIMALLRPATHPMAALAIFNAILIATHLPATVDRLMSSQIGSFVIDAAWLAGGSILWWPVLSPVPERRLFQFPVKMGYLFLNTLPATAMGAFLAFADYPLYAVYELAPPLPGISTHSDQQAAGVMMMTGGHLVFWAAITILFFSWSRREEADSPPFTRILSGPRL